MLLWDKANEDPKKIGKQIADRGKWNRHGLTVYGVLNEKNCAFD
jgi:hypothetical protein